MKKLAVVLAVAFAVYWFGLRDGCGTSGSIACPAAELEEGVGLQLKPREVCPNAGYLCHERSSFQVARWPLTTGRLRVRVSLPTFADKETAQILREAAIAGIQDWDGHPFPLVIDAGAIPLRISDIEVVWTEGLNNAAAGVANNSWRVAGKGLKFKSHGIAVVVPPMPMGPALRVRIKATAMHEMGHALGLMHSDSRFDVMFPSLPEGATDMRASARDLRTADALYALPNGAMVQ